MEYAVKILHQGIPSPAPDVHSFHLKMDFSCLLFDMNAMQQLLADQLNISLMDR